jgi:hypothetical protein
LGISASDFYDHLERSPGFERAMEDARARAQATLLDRATAAADRGNDRLLKFFQDAIQENPLAKLTDAQLEQRVANLLAKLLKQNSFAVRHVPTGEVFDLELEDLEVISREYPEVVASCAPDPDDSEDNT